MSRNNPSLLTVFSYLPWWASILAGSFVYVVLSFVLPFLVAKNQMLIIFVGAAKSYALLFSLLFLIPAISSFFKRRKRNKLLEDQKSIEILRETSWSDFEILVGEAFRRNGYKVQENMVGGADGGVDLTLAKDGKLHIVQCKQWRTSKVGVAVVREMFGVMTASTAQTVFVVTSGDFTNDAINFARKLPIELINGKALLSMIEEVQSSTKSAVIPKAVIADDCPKCSSPLVKRIARKGAYKGNEFWGCSSFPKCRHTMNS